MPRHPIIPPEQPASTVYARLAAAIAAEAEPPPRARVWPWYGKALAGVGTLALGIGGDGLLRQRTWLRGDLHDVLTPWLAALPLSVGLALGATFVACAKGGLGLGVRVPLLRAVALAVTPLSLSPWLLVLGREETASAARAELDPLGVPCLLIALGIGALSLAWLARELRSGVPVAVGWRSAALGAAAGAWAGLALWLHCPSAAAVHLLAGHLLPVASLPLVGLLALRRYVRP